MFFFIDLIIISLLLSILALLALSLVLALIDFLAILRSGKGEDSELQAITQMRRSRIRARLVRVFRFGVFFTVLAAFKAGWVLYFYPGMSGPVVDKTCLADAMMRRAYLAETVATPDFGLHLMPPIYSPMARKEWAICTLSMTTAAFTNLAFEVPETQPEAVPQIKIMIERILKPDIRSYEIDYWGEDALESLDGPNGHAGYLGHLGFMLAAYRMAGGGDEYDSLLEKITAALARRVLATPSGNIPTFPDETWVPDNVVVIADLALAQRVLKLDYHEAIEHWRNYAKTHLLDPKTGLLVAYVKMDGKPSGPPRGSFIGYNGFFLPFFDAPFAEEQFRGLHSNFFRRLPFGALAVREFLPGQAGFPDINSGPIIFGLSVAGTGFALAGASHYKFDETKRGLLLTAEIAGGTLEWNGQRTYLFSPLVGDAVMLAMRTARQWDERYLKGGGSL